MEFVSLGCRARGPGPLRREAYPGYELGRLKCLVTLKMEAIFSSETLVPTRATRHKVPEDNFPNRYWSSSNPYLTQEELFRPMTVGVLCAVGATKIAGLASLQRHMQLAKDILVLLAKVIIH
jgi:hypothetical protein